ncbi:MAG TPA: hypothetical protein VHJ17_03670 [Thermomonospora sp.]|nr:hypothetical protein [Thermomonospora sp.]
MTGRWAGVAAIGWSALYVASKVHLALEERLGVTGGPHVPPERYAAYGPGEVARAQWANAAVGLLVIAVAATALLTLRHRAARWTVLTALGTCTLVAAVGAAGMLGGALLTDRGGAPFGAYCAIWTALLALTTTDLHRRTRASAVRCAESSPATRSGRGFLVGQDAGEPLQ